MSSSLKIAEAIGEKGGAVPELPEDFSFTRLRVEITSSLRQWLGDVSPAEEVSQNLNHIVTVLMLCVL